MPTPDGSHPWLGWMSPLWPVWLWHATFDGTWLCPCQHSKEYKEAKRK